MKNKPLIIERTYNATIENVWKAITDKDQMKQWYFDLEEFKPEVGFEFQFEGGKDGKCYAHLCKVTEVIPGKKLTYSWRYEGYEGNSLVTFELFSEGEKTRLKLTHEGLESFPESNPDLAKVNFVEGWKEIIGTSLKEFVEKDTIKKSIEINAPADKVWEILVNHDYIRKWASAFGEGTFVEADRTPGSEVLWKDNSGEAGAKGRVEKNKYASLLKVGYYDDVNADASTPTGEYTETYDLNSQNGKTIISIEAGLLPLKHVYIHLKLWDNAVIKMKELAENL
ncbi:hypothetical protein BH23BAC1_BH23BAC1_46440 [soil metagenome]